MLSYYQSMIFPFSCFPLPIVEHIRARYWIKKRDRKELGPLVSGILKYIVCLITSVYQHPFPKLKRQVNIVYPVTNLLHILKSTSKYWGLLALNKIPQLKDRRSGFDKTCPNDRAYYWTRFELHISWLLSAVSNRCDKPTPCSFFIRKLKPRYRKSQSE